MLRLAVVAVAVLVSRFVVAALIGWLANRPRARWTHVAVVSNTAIFTSVGLTITEFTGRGFNLYSVLFALLMLYLAYSGAQLGLVGFSVVKAKERVPEERVVMEVKPRARATPSDPVLAGLDRQFEELNKKGVSVEEYVEAMGKFDVSPRRVYLNTPAPMSKSDEAAALAFANYLIAEEERKLAEQGKSREDLTAREFAAMHTRIGERMQKWKEERGIA